MENEGLENLTRAYEELKFSIENGPTVTQPIAFLPLSKAILCLPLSKEVTKPIEQELCVQYECARSQRKID